MKNLAVIIDAETSKVLEQMTSLDLASRKARTMDKPVYVCRLLKQNYIENLDKVKKSPKKKAK